MNFLKILKLYFFYLIYNLMKDGDKKSHKGLITVEY